MRDAARGKAGVEDTVKASVEVRLLAAILLAVAALHLVGASQSSTDDFLFCVLCWVCVASLVSRERESGLGAAGSVMAGIGTVMLAVTSVRMTLPAGHFFKVAPLMAGVAVALLAAGRWGVIRFSRPLVVLGLMGTPELVWSMTTVMSGIDVAPFTAAAASWLLSICGVPAVREGAAVVLPGAMVEVLPPCSGVKSMMFLFSVSVLALVMFPPARRWWFPAVPVLAVAMAFGINSIRVAALAVLVMQHREDAFEYWHDGSGSMMVTPIAIAVFAALYFRFVGEALRQEAMCPVPENPDSGGMGRRGIVLSLNLAFVLAALGWYFVPKPTPSVTAFEFPEEVALEGWQACGSSIPPEDEAEAVVLARRRYAYRQAGAQLEIEMIYLKDHDGDLRNAKKWGKEGFPAADYRVSAGHGSHALWRSDTRMQLGSFLNPQGASTATPAEFLQLRYRHDLTPGRLLNWLLGRSSLRDPRCIFVHLSLTPETGPPEGAIPALESAWFSWSGWWTARFPSRE